MNIQLKKNLELVFIYCVSLTLIIILSYHYFDIDADGVNGPVVWIELQKKGLSVLSDWYPTPDNWYFTLYPVYFLMYFITGSTGSGMLIYGVILFAFLVTILSIAISKKTQSKSSIIVCSIPLAFLPHIYWTEGFVQHPFAHYSTVAFGLLIVYLNIIWKEKQKSLHYLIIGVLGLIVCSSDMWVAPTFLLPLLLTELIECIKGRTKKRNILILLVFFITAFNHTIPKILGINSQPFIIVDYKVIVANIHQVILIIGEMFNIFIAKNKISYLLSFFTVGFIFIFYCVYNITHRNNSAYISLLALFSVSGIIMAYVISNQTPDQRIPRFFVNIAPFLFISCAITINKYAKIISYILCSLFIASSLNSYDYKKETYKIKENEIKDYISFLKENKLHFGYGDYWEKSLTSFWLSNGEVVVVPVSIDSDGIIDFNTPRYQTMRTWYSRDYKTRKSNEKYFIALTGKEACGNEEECIEKISKHLSQPEQILRYGNMTIMVFKN